MGQSESAVASSMATPAQTSLRMANFLEPIPERATSPSIAVTHGMRTGSSVQPYTKSATLGLGHSAVTTAVMYAFANGVTTLQPDDIAGIRVIYGPAVTGVGSVSIGDVTITEGNAGTTLATFTVTRTGGTGAFGVNFAHRERLRHGGQRVRCNFGYAHVWKRGQHPDDLGDDQRRHRGRAQRDVFRQPVGGHQWRYYSRRPGPRHHP